MVLGMTETRWWKYLSDLMGDDTPTVASKKAGISPSNFTRWKQGANADPEFVVKIARSYHANVLDALVAAEFITEDEAITSDNINRFKETVKQLEVGRLDIQAISEILYRRLAQIESAYISEVLNVDRFSIEKLGTSERMKKFEEAIETASKPAITSNVRMMPGSVHPISDDEIADAVREANELRGAAQDRTEELIEPENP